MDNKREWKAFCISSLFTCELSPGDNQAEKLQSGKTPLISSGNSTSNGIVKFILNGDGKSVLFSGNKITVDMFGFAAYQESPFFAVSHGRINILTPRFTMNRYVGEFIAGAINISNKGKYSYSVMCSNARLINQQVVLPATSNGTPDYEYMEKYIKDLEQKKIDEYLEYAKKELEKLGEIEEIPKIEEKEWKSFNIKSLFSGNIAKALDFSKTTEGDNVFIGRQSSSNGIQGFVKNETVEDGACLTIGMVGNPTCYYQTKPFVASQNVLVLRSANCNKLSYQFISVSINALLSKYSYGKPVGLASFMKDKIMLPITADGTPDYEYMEKYIRNLMIKKYREYVEYRKEKKNEKKY